MLSVVNLYARKAYSDVILLFLLIVRAVKMMLFFWFVTPYGLVEQYRYDYCFYLLLLLLPYLFSRLGGVGVCVLATGPKGCGFEPGQGD
jgi:hypothetical protein